MKIIKLVCVLLILGVNSLYGQVIKLNATTVVPNKVFLSIENLRGKEVVRVIKDSTARGADAPTFALVKNINFQNGIIELSVLSKLLPTASPTDRGFIGIAFRVNEDKSKFECIYIRPTNGRAEEQVRRNHSIQYFSFPDYPFSRLRKEAPEMYESYADMELNKWIKMKIVVKGSQAKLFLNGNSQPSLIVNDLKHGADLSGAVGFFVDGGTDGFFRDLKITRQ